MSARPPPPCTADTAKHLRRAVRELVRKLHAWTGLGLGFVFVVVGLSGSWLVFYPELDLLLDPARRVTVATPPIRLDAVIAALHAAEPRRDGPWRIEMPRYPDAPIQARYYRPEETRERSFAPLLLTLSPIDLRITRRGFWGEDPSTWLYNLHYTLLMDTSGKTVLAVCAILIIALLLSGMYLWWPRSGNWRGALAFKTGAAWKRRIYDWHVKTGVYTLLLSLLLCGSGLMLLKPVWFSPVLAYFSPITPGFALPESPDGAAAASIRISADDAVAIAHTRFPAAELRWIETPSRERPVWRIQLRQPGEPNRRFPRTQVWIDADTGEIVGLRDPRQASGSDTLLAWLHPLHNGEAFGLTGRIVVCLAGLLPLLAWLTGITRWRHRMKARKH